jgi:hypothetical protein
MSDNSELEWIRHARQMEALGAQENADRERMRPFYLLRPRVYPDGNQWCALYGDNLQEGVCGFGDTPAKAAEAFDVEWVNGKLYYRPWPSRAG